MEFAQYIMNLGVDAVYSQWKEHRDIILSREEINNVYSARKADSYALIVTAAELAKKCFSIQFNTDDICNLLLGTELEVAGELDIGENAYNQFKEQLVKYSRYFTYDDDNQVMQRSQHWGKIENHNGTKIAFVLPSAFREMLHEIKYENTDNILKLWRDQGLLDCEEKRLKKKKTINEQHRNVWVHAIRLRDDYYVKKLPAVRSDGRTLIGNCYKKVMTA